MNLLNRNLLWLIGLTMLAAIIYYFSDIFAYILIAWVLSMLGRPIVVFYRKRLKIGKFRMGPTLAAILTILTFYTGIIGILLLFIPTILVQGQQLSEVDYQALGDKLRPMFFHLDSKMHQVGILSQSESLATKIQEILSAWFKPTLLGDILGGFLGVAGNVLVAFASVSFILFFFLQDNRLFTDIIHAAVPDEMEEKVQTAVQESSEVLTRYFQGLLIQVVVFALLATLLLWLLGIDNALLIGSFGGAFNVIPYVGPILGMVFGGFITLSSSLATDISQILPMLAKVAVVFMVVQAIDNNIVGPLILSKSVQAHPLEIFIVTLAAAKMGGVMGMVIGIPVYTVLRVVARNFFSHFKIVQRLTDHLEEETEEKPAVRP